MMQTSFCSIVRSQALESWSMAFHDAMDVDASSVFHISHPRLAEDSCYVHTVVVDDEMLLSGTLSPLPMLERFHILEKNEVRG